MKERLDVLLVKRGLAESREKAKAIIMSGIVYVEDQKEDKAGTTFDENAKIEVRGSTLKYVSRGGLKLEKAMTHFGVTLDQRSVWMSARPQADLPTVCCRMARSRCFRSM